MSKEIKKNSFKAVLLSAGLGTRLRPITEKIPKCLVEINNVPILERWLSHLEELGCKETLVNTHYFHEKVRDFLSKRNSKKMKIIETYEEKLLGTAGTLIKNIDFFDDSKIIMIHCDNFTNFNLQKLIDANDKRPKDCYLTMLTFQTSSPQKCGIIERDKKMIVQGFYEKVTNPPSNIANAAIYMFDRSFVIKLKKEMPNAIDFSTDVLPKFIGQIYSLHTKDFFLDIGTIENLSNAKKRFSKN